ncbi:MAG: hypothetical protein EG825_15160, partial [Rhodocyclaceae bacterium]|nr:hypothetical protein [Rhodocyclaceae bacterium]
MKLGFIGLGAMGQPMVEHLLAAGHEMALWARHTAQAAPFLALGATLRIQPRTATGVGGRLKSTS